MSVELTKFPRTKPNTHQSSFGSSDVANFGSSNVASFGSSDVASVKHQQREYSCLTGNNVTSTVSNSLLGFNDPYYTHEKQMTREFYNNIQCKNGVYQTIVKYRFIILDEDLLVDVGGLARFDHSNGYFEEKWMSAFEPVKVYISMLRYSQRSEATNKPHASTLAVEYRLLYTLLAYCLTYFEDVDLYPVCNELPPPVDSSDEESVVHLVQYHDLDAVEDDEEAEVDPEENSDDD
ncbi:hypothetical protein Lal_00042581 [Lupinus albus]|nr:hypothetical protein Lal_00042581 [Lupinus albus]